MTRNSNIFEILIYFINIETNEYVRNTWAEVLLFRLHEGRRKSIKTNNKQFCFIFLTCLVNYHTIA